jgi:hypothetical protein
VASVVPEKAPVVIAQVKDARLSPGVVQMKKSTPFTFVLSDSVNESVTALGAEMRIPFRL